MGCSCGDSIHSTVIDSYESLLDRADFCSPISYGLSVEEIDSLYKYAIDDVKNYSDIIPSELLTDMSDLTVSDGTLSILVKRLSYYDYVSPDTQIVQIMTALQNLMIVHYGNMKYLNLITKKIRGSLTKLSKSYLKPYYSGYYLQDMKCCLYNDTKEVEDFLRSHISDVNKRLTSCLLVDVRINTSYRVMPSDMNIMIGTLNRSLFKDLVERYQDWYSLSEGNTVTILEQDIRASINLMLGEKDISKDDIMIKISQKDDKWVMGFCAPVGVSPYLVVKKLYPKVKLNEIYHACNFMITNVLRKCNSDTQELNLRCSKCGRVVFYDMINQRHSNVCPECLMRYLMSRYIKK